MATLQTSGAISLSEVQSVFGGSNPISMSEYYRGGANVPSTGSGSYSAWYGQYDPSYYVTDWGDIVWNNTYIGAFAANATSATFGGYTYQMGALWDYVFGKYTSILYYEVRRAQTSVSINTGIPSSGTISMSQFYGGRDP